ncbi:MAG: glycosyltransferase family 4 protein [Paracoccus sp. (in: a-proteobacteria)]|uniref:glycosyltransferase family 4 protein n=1 Tax=Paracoccus sp. TaxID=267 RepID=UPI0026DF1CA7|nr:glycosyltransferase family 4 protein [Paracoccus sp. (in: a-proteobacteria)]MDO5622706.1 glycosyltransferase family 4 protein [Paracoccus sp. (in: a-proteobacteria)]
MLKGSGADPLRHYLTVGWQQGANPSAMISTAHYLLQFPDLMGGTVSPLEHYIAAGMPPSTSLTPGSGGRTVWTGFLPDAFGSFIGTYGYDAEAFPAMPLQAAELVVAMFSPQDYRRRHPELTDSTQTELLAHYLSDALPKGEPPGPLFDADHYARQLNRLKMQPPDGAPFLDWLRRGRAVGISPNPAFDKHAYHLLNPGLSEGMDHWLLHGLRENRQYLPNITMGALPLVAGAPARSGLGRVFAETVAGPAAADLAAMQAFRADGLKKAIAAANAIEPQIGMISEKTPSFMPPWHDNLFQLFKACVARLPEGQFHNVVAVPFVKLGGSDFVAGVLTKALTARSETILVLRTEQPDWERPDWFPDNVATADLSDLLTQVDMPMRAQLMYALLHHVDARRLFNVNSRAAYETLQRFGSQLRRFIALYTYYFCADRRPNGTEVGYAIDFFAPLQRHLDCALIDNADFAQTLIDRHALAPEQAQRIQPIYSPTMEPAAASAVVDAQVASAGSRARPRILWAGRFDRQKRFDLVQDIARQMSQVDFLCWGKAVLDQPPDLSQLPANMSLMGVYTSIDELPLTDCDGWLYTSGWDGLPTILIEIAARGMPVVASAVGGVPELVTPQTGWPVPPDAGTDDYVRILREMLEAPGERQRRGRALLDLARSRHSQTHYRRQLDSILDGQKVSE